MNLTNHSQFKHKMFAQFFKTFFGYAKFRAFLSVTLLVFLGLTQGIGLLLILPLFQVLGLTGAENQHQGITSFFSRGMESVGLPHNLISVLCFYIAIVSIYALIHWYNTLLDARLVYGFEKYLRNNLYEKLSHMDWMSFTRIKNSDILHLLTQDLQRVAYGTRLLLQLIGLIILVIVYVIVALLISIPLTLCALVCSGGIFLALGPLSRKSFQTGDDLRQNISHLFSTTKDHLDGMKIAKSYSLEDIFKRNFMKITQQYLRLYLNFTRISAATRLFYQIGAVVTLSLFLFFAVEVIHLQVANLLLLVFIFARLLPQFSSLQQNMQRLLNTLPSFKEILRKQKQFEEAREFYPKKETSPISFKQEICLQNVSFRYDKNQKTWALQNINIGLPAKSMTAIVGPSGAGKSTLADVLMGLLIPEEGDLFVDRVSLKNDFIYSWRRSIGYVPQETFLFNDTLRKNLLIANPCVEEKELWIALKTVVADELVLQLPKKMDTVLGERGVRLSGGERQRIALARALLRKPSLLILDEATSALDTENEQRIQEAVNRLHGEMTVVIIAHRLSTLKNSDQIIVLDAGRVVETGSWENLVSKQNGRFKAMLQSGKF